MKPRQTTKKRPKKNRDPNRMDPTQVAHFIGATYQRARNMMLAGVFGDSKYENGKLSVAKSAVIVYKSAPPAVRHK